MPTPAPARALSNDPVYLRAELQRAIKERDAVKASLTAADGPAAFWRNQAKDTQRKLTDALNRVDGLRKAEHEQRGHAIRFAEEVDGLKRAIADVKRQLWEQWSGLEDGAPLKAALWEIWAGL